MMGKNRAIQVVLAVGMLLVGCGQSDAEGNISPSISQESALSAPSVSGQMESNSFAEYEDMVMPVFMSGVSAFSWDSGAEIQPESLANFYMIDTLLRQYPEGWEDRIEVPVEEIAQTLSSTFEGVTAQQLRQDPIHYVESSDSLAFLGGLGGGSTYEITDVRVQDGLTVIEIDYLAGGIPGNVIRHSVLTADFTENPRKWNSCETMELNGNNDD